MLINRRKFNPLKEELERLVWEQPTLHVAKIFGVSDKAIDKRCKLLGIQKPGRGYWAKLRAAQKNAIDVNVDLAVEVSSDVGAHSNIGAVSLGAPANA